VGSVRGTLLWCVGLAFVLTLAGCGGQGGQSENTLTPEELRQQACGIYKKAFSQMTALEPPRSDEEIRAFIDQALPIEEEANRALQALQPPDELAADWQRFIALIDKGVGTFRDARNALHDNDVPRAGRLFAELASASEEEVTASRALGIEACVSSRTKQEPLFK
jgi:Flp pilus assembly protein TadD